MKFTFSAGLRSGPGKWIVRCLVVLFVLAAIGAGWFWYANDFQFYIEMAGAREVTLEYGKPYHEPGAQIFLKGKLVCTEGVTPEGASLRITSDVCTDAPGKYSVTYTASYNWWQVQDTRTVRVVDTQSPVITLVADDVPGVRPGNVYEEAGFSAYDNVDGDITHRVVRREEEGKITYAVVDSSGNPASATREVPGFDPIYPRITLTGGTDVQIQTGRFYEDPGFSAWDNSDGDITEQVAVEGEVIWYKPGTYPVTYTVTDNNNHTTTVTRNVRVIAEPRIEGFQDQGKIIYLTFDDGPGPHTPKLLDILDAYGVQATFFVVENEHSDMLKDIVDRGHSIGIHCVTHDYETVYASPEAYFEDLFRMQDIIYEKTGVKTTLMRFPGGSSNTISRKTCPGLMTILSEAVQDAGFQYFDWNVDSEDAGGAKKSRQVSRNVINGVSKNEVSIVLQHDIHDFSVEAVEEIIRWGMNNGYLFLPLEPHSPGFRHTVVN